MKIYENEKFEKLSQKYISLDNDLNKLKKLLEKIPKGKNSEGVKFFRCDNLKEDAQNKKYIFKTRLRCQSLGSKEKMRLVYFYDGKKIELIFIEIYFKGKKESEDKKLVEDF